MSFQTNFFCIFYKNKLFLVWIPAHGLDCVLENTRASANYAIISKVLYLSCLLVLSILDQPFSLVFPVCIGGLDILLVKEVELENDFNIEMRKHCIVPSDQ